MSKELKRIRKYIGNNYGKFLSEFPHQKKKLYFTMEEVLEILTQYREQGVREVAQSLLDTINENTKSNIVAEGGGLVEFAKMKSLASFITERYLPNLTHQDNE